MANDVSEWTAGIVRRFLTAGLAFAPIAIAQPAAAFNTLYSFTGAPDGAFPERAVIKDAAGNLYGITDAGGSGSCNTVASGCGTVFELALDGTETVLHSFSGGKKDGSEPRGSLIRDAAGNLYGTTTFGGRGGCNDYGSPGCGTLFKLAPPTQGQTQWTETVLYSFDGGSNDGAFPQAGLLADRTGNLYGTTLEGGSGNCTNGCGTVFELAADGTESLLYSFAGGSDDGESPNAQLIKDKAGNVYGTTEGGGGSNDGTVFQLAPPAQGQTQWTEIVLHAFTGSDGSSPDAGLIKDTVGNLYGTTFAGGTYDRGTVFKLAAGGTKFAVLHSFASGSDGSSPLGPLVMDTAGNLYGTTCLGGPDWDGTVFKVAPDGAETVLYSFTGGTDGDSPYSGLIRDGKGHLVGTTTNAFTNSLGTVFKVKE